MKRQGGWYLGRGILGHLRCLNANYERLQLPFIFYGAESRGGSVYRLTGTKSGYRRKAGTGLWRPSPSYSAGHNGLPFGQQRKPPDYTRNPTEANALSAVIASRSEATSPMLARVVHRHIRDQHHRHLLMRKRLKPARLPLLWPARSRAPSAQPQFLKEYGPSYYRALYLPLPSIATLRISLSTLPYAGTARHIHTYPTLPGPRPAAGSRL
jgi:hypothetical protein